MAVNIPPDFKIEQTVSIEEAIGRYFAYIKEVSGHFDTYLQRHRELDYFKMRRFLNTAYRSLKEIDPDFRAQKLLTLAQRLQKIAQIYDEFVHKSRLGAKAFEMVYLYQQEGFLAYEQVLSNNAKEIKQLQNQVERFDKAIALQKERLKRLSSFSSEFDRQEEELRRLKNRENRAWIRLNTITKENTLLNKAIDDFRTAHEQAFSASFSKFITLLKPKLFTILNAIAYEFEIELWHKAKESEKIQNHFRNAYSQEVISSKSYLKYYLKGLDENKLSAEHLELKTLLEYLNNNTPINILIYMQDLEDVTRYKNALDSDNSGFVIFSHTEAKPALTSALKSRIDMMIIDTHISPQILDNFIRTYRDNMTRLGKRAKLILVAEKITPSVMAQAKKYQADSLLEYDVDHVEIIDAVYAMFKVDLKD